MKKSAIIASLFASLTSVLAAATVLYSENFDQSNGAFVSSPEVQVSPVPGLQSWGAIQTVANNQLSTTTADGHGGLRFGGATSRFNWAPGAIGAAITDAGGFTVSFDWTESGLTGDRWVAWKVGTANADNRFITTNVADYSIVLRDDGSGVTIDSGGTPGTVPVGTTTGTMHAVTLTYMFSSFAAGSPVGFTAKVDGTEVVTSSFTWDTADDMRMELQANNAGELINNLVIATVPEPSSFGLLLSCVTLLALRRRR